MHRKNLLDQLRRHVPQSDRERQSTRRTVDFVRAHPDCFERSLAIGHVTGSAWLLDAAGDNVLLTHHRKLGKWLQLGGHADGRPDVLAVALQEAKEESGIDEIVPLSPDIFDVDVHRIPAGEEGAAHDHYDIRFLMQVRADTPYRVGRESIDLGWFSETAVMKLEVDRSVRQMCEKWRRLRCQSARWVC